MIQQGDIYWVQLDPTKGKEQKGVRPCVVVSGKSMNTFSGLSVVCPLTSVLKHYFGDVVVDPSPENGLSSPSEILVSQLRTIDQQRFEEKIGQISAHQLQKVLKGIFLMLTR